jgi:hypothetical protein
LALYLALALWANRIMLPAPAHLFPMPADYMGTEWEHIEISDQRMVAWLIARNARMWVTRPTTLFDAEQCYPQPHATTLGEHMFGNGLLGVVPHLLSGDPVIVYNTVVVLVLWLGAVGVYALVVNWTNDVGAAFVAGLLFGFHPIRVGDPMHPFVIGYQWIPLALLFARRLFERGKWLDALGLVISLNLELLESFYPVIALAIIGGVYGGYLALRNLRRLRVLAPQLAAVVAATGVFAVALFLPYLKTRAAWSTLRGRPPLLLSVGEFAPGGSAYVGSVLLVLAAIALIDRLRSPRVDRPRADKPRLDDPRWIILTAGLLTLWASIVGFTIPIVDIDVPSLFTLAGRVVPGFDAVRAGGALRLGVNLAAAILAGYGVAAAATRARRTALAAITAAALIELFYNPVTRVSFGRSTEMIRLSARPDEDLIALLEAGVSGPVVDLPLSFGLDGVINDLAHYLFLGAYHKHPVAACYNSFLTPVQDGVERLAAQVPAPGAAEALYALGFRTVIVHEELIASGPREALLRALAQQGPRQPGRGRFARVGSTGTHTVYTIEADNPVAADFSMLAASEVPLGVVEVTPPLGNVELVIRNSADVVYRHPQPLALTLLFARWVDASGQSVKSQQFPLLLPLALPAGGRDQQNVLLLVPPTLGLYQVVVTLVAQPGLVIARRDVRVLAAQKSEVRQWLPLPPGR